MADPALTEAAPHPLPNEEDLVGRTVGLVLAGGGARGAFELGALSVLLPRIEKKYGRPKVIVGTSAGALNAAYLAATIDEKNLADALQEGCEIWRKMSWGKVAKHAFSQGPFWRTVFDAAHVPWFHSWSLLDSSPLRKTLECGHLSDGFPTGLPFERIRANLLSGHLDTAAVATTRGFTSQSVIFCDRRPGLTVPEEDRRRGIRYQLTRLGVDHVMASAAIPSVFPAHRVPPLPGWYQDGGTRLNAPISPALRLGVELLIIVALHSPYLEQSPDDPNMRPETVDGAAQIIQGLLIDPLINDLHTLAKINTIVSKPGFEGKEKVVPYIVVAPAGPDEIGEIATSCFEEHYGGVRNILQKRTSIGLLGWLLDVGDNPFRGELLSNLLFDGRFAIKLIEAGQQAACDWLADEHDVGPWQVLKLPLPD